MVNCLLFQIETTEKPSISNSREMFRFSFTEVIVLYIILEFPFMKKVGREGKGKELTQQANRFAAASQYLLPKILNNFLAPPGNTYSP